MDINYVKDRCSFVGSCWIWIGSKNAKGYGRLTYQQQGWYAHRFSFVASGRQLKKGMHICHSCDNPSCCNPEHLFQGSPKENEQDKIKKKRNIRGTQSHYAKLDVEQIRMILSLKGTASQQRVGELFNVSQQTIGRIWRGETYKDELLVTS